MVTSPLTRYSDENDSYTFRNKTTHERGRSRRREHRRYRSPTIQRFSVTRTKHDEKHTLQQKHDKSAVRLNPELFKYVKRCLNFASKQLAQLRHYWTADPNNKSALGHDAFTYDWKQLRLYLNKLFELLDRVICKIINERAFGILIVPKWKTATWYQPLKRITIRKTRLPPACFMTTDNKVREPPRWRTLAVLVDGARY